MRLRATYRKIAAFFRPGVRKGIDAGLMLACAAALFGSLHPGAPRSAPGPPSETSNPDYVRSKIEYEQRYKFIDYGHNYIQWNTTGAVSNIFRKLKQTSYRRARVLHIGDSHVQADMVTGAIRNKLQEVFGNGGRGMIFPYAAARTHAGYDYHTYSWGNWDYARNIQSDPKLPLGAAGVSARTTDLRAGFKIAFNSFYNQMENVRLRVYCATGPESFALEVICNDGKPDTLDCSNAFHPFAELTLREAPRTLKCKIIRAQPGQKSFTCFGLSLERPGDDGILYHSVGINGAGFKSVLRQDLMKEHIMALNPDLAVIDLSGNEYYLGGLNEPDFEQGLRDVVMRIREGAPFASILITCSQDIYRYGRYSIADCLPAARIAAKVAFDMNCAFYDYYRVSGGRYAMQRWRRYGLAKRDRVHLTFEGYKVKGELFANALLRSYEHYLRGNEQSPLNADSIGVPSFKLQSATVQPAAAVTTSGAGETSRVRYRIQSGDVLGVIAERYNVSVSDLRRWNNLRNDYIRAGDYLDIYVPSSKKSSGGGSSGSAGAAPKKYVVRSGDTLWSIAQDNDLTVPELKKRNNLQSDKLSVGQELIIHP